MAAAFASLATALALALLWGAGAWHKLADFDRWRGVVANYRLLPTPLELPAAVALPAAECAALLLLPWPATRAGGGVLGAALLALYAAALSLNLARGRTRIDCGCLGAGTGIAPWMVVRNAVLAAVSLALAALPAAMPPAAQVAFAAGLAATLAVLYPVLDVVFGSLTRAPVGAAGGAR